MNQYLELLIIEVGSLLMGAVVIIVPLWLLELHDKRKEKEAKKRK